MIQETSAAMPEETARAVRLTLGVCGSAAVIVVVVMTLLGHGLEGLAVAVGLALGAGNALLARQLFRYGVPYAATSLARLTALSGVAVASGVFLGWRRVFLVVAGLAAAQLVSSALSAREAIRR